MLLSSTAGCSNRTGARHLVLLTVDTWRADHAFTTRGGEDLTPVLDMLSATSTRFTTASSASNQTSPGLAGILTGLFPFRSGVLINDHVLPPSLPTLATILKNAGFSTGGFVSNPVVGPGYGFDRGFDHYELVRRSPRFRKAKAAAVNRAVLAWIENLELDDSRRVLLWVHYMEPHGPYQPEPECRRLFPAEAFGDYVEVPLLPQGRNDGREGVPSYQQAGFDPVPIDGRDYVRRYAAEVRCVDSAIGDLLEALERRGFLASAALVITADHGEALMNDHGYYFSHGNGLTEDQVRVPLLVRLPGQSKPHVINEPVSTVDILPTVLQILQITPPKDIDGVPLLAGTARPVISAAHTSSSLRLGKWKLVRESGVNSRTLFDLEADPEETADLSSSMTSVRDSVERRMVELLSRRPLASPVNRRNLDDETRAALRALGYASE
jgi:arylsulfatase A-like enzyme